VIKCKCLGFSCYDCGWVTAVIDECKAVSVGQSSGTLIIEAIAKCCSELIPRIKTRKSCIVMFSRICWNPRKAFSSSLQVILNRLYKYVPVARLLNLCLMLIAIKWVVNMWFMQLSHNSPSDFTARLVLQLFIQISKPMSIVTCTTLIKAGCVGRSAVRKAHIK